MGKTAVVINYESLHKVNSAIFDYLIVDEAPKISAYPKKSKARQELDRFIHPKIKVIWLSGTSHIESSAQMFHQLSLSPRHSFSKYLSNGNSTAFHAWYKGGDSFAKYRGPDKSYGIEGATIRKAGGKEMSDYSQVISFPEKFLPIMIKNKHTEINMNTKVIVRYIDMSEEISLLYHNVKTQKCSVEYDIEPLAPAQLLSKLHQIANGAYIDSSDTNVLLCNKKASEVYRNHPESIVFYKYQNDRTILLSVGFKEDQLLQTDSNILGLNLSHYDDMVIYSLTWSGQNYTQCLARICDFKRETRPIAYVYLSVCTVEQDIYNSVSTKKSFNDKFLKEIK